MNTLKNLFFILILMPLVGIPLASAAPPNTGRPAQATRIRPIEDFVNRQGTFCIDTASQGGYEGVVVDGNFVGNCSTGNPPLLFVPPIANFIGLDNPASGTCISMDYAGLTDYWMIGALGTSYSGTVIEKPLEDGRALVEILLHTRDTLAYVVQGDVDEGCDYYNDTLLFGNRAPEVLYEGAQPALGDSQLNLKFINPEPGYPLPDLIQLVIFPEGSQEEGFRQELLFLSMRAQARGPLHEAYGVADGTPGLATTSQTGLMGHPLCGLEGPWAIASCFPVEHINLRVIGR